MRLALVPRPSEFYGLFTEAGANAVLAARKAEVLFRERRWSELRRLARGALAAGRQDERLAWWAGAEPSREAPHG